jgi:hypothetical protein
VRVYLRLLALISLCAWLSMASQLLLLVGAHGLLPIAPLLDEARREHVSFFALPTVFWLSASDGALLGAACLGAAASLYGVLRPGRAWIALSLPLYLSVCIAAQDFCGFQWDNLLLEASFVALFLDARAPTRAALWLPRLLLVKLYVESGIAKLTSPLGDWISGSAMSVYFETAPLPAPLARMFHSLPQGVLHASAWGVLVLELVVPLFVFGPRPLRRAAFVLLGGLQLINLLTANYGFFVPLSAVLHVWLLDDETLARLRLRTPEITLPSRRARVTGWLALATWTLLSVLEGHLHLGGASPSRAMAWIDRGVMRARELYAPFRVFNTYHLFASVTTERIEPIVEVRTDAGWGELALRYKPGPVERGLPFLAPHQPRVAFQLWFHGLAWRGPAPRYLVRLEQLLCEAPSEVAPLFSTAPPPHAVAVRIRYDRYTFTRPGDPNTWRREPIAERTEWPCTAADAEETASSRQ